jgi:hypothetical protein
MRNSRYILRRMDHRAPQGAEPGEQPSRRTDLPVRFFKAAAQVAIGAGALVAILVQLARALAAGQTLVEVHHQVFALIGLALTLAAVVELAYALYDQGPDQVLDPLVLAVAGALVFQLGGAASLDVRDGVAALLYVAALGGLSAIRKHLSRTQPPKEEPIRIGWQQFQRWTQERRRPRPRNGGRTRAKEGRHGITRTAPAQEGAAEPAVQDLGAT